jgi:tetratricopeptide (TPR) repeat protein
MFRIEGTARCWRALVLSASIAALVWPRLALAQPPTAPPIPSRAEMAKAEYERGLRHYNLADYDSAIAAFKRAYELSATPDPVLLFNIARAYGQKGDCKQAVTMYRSFLREAGKHPNRRDAETAIERCARQDPSSAPAPEPGATPAASSLVPPPTAAPEPGGAPAATAPAAATTPGPVSPSPVAPPPVEAPPLPLTPHPPAADATLQATPAAPPRPGRLKKITGLAVGGTGAALFLGGMLAGLKAKGAEKDVDDAFKGGATWSQELSDKEKDGKGAARAANVLFGLGVAAMAGGGVLYYLGVKEARAASASTSIGLSPGGVWLSGRF